MDTDSHDGLVLPLSMGHGLTTRDVPERRNVRRSRLVLLEEASPERVLSGIDLRHPVLCGIPGRTRIARWVVNRNPRRLENRSLWNRARHHLRTRNKRRQMPTGASSIKQRSTERIAGVIGRFAEQLTRRV